MSSTTARARAMDAGQARFAAAVARLAAYVEEEGHPHVPAGYRYRDGFALGAWLGNQRRDRRAGVLSTSRARALERLGVDWAPRRGPRAAA